MFTAVPHACLTGLLSPIHRPVQPEVFSVRPDELRATLRVIQAEMARRTGTLDHATDSLHRPFRMPDRHTARAWAAAAPGANTNGKGSDNCLSEPLNLC